MNFLYYVRIDRKICAGTARLFESGEGPGDKATLCQQQKATGRSHFACLVRNVSQIYLLLIFNGGRY